MVAVVVLGGLFMLARTLSTAPPPAVIIPVLSSASPDLEAITRMIGDIELPAAGQRPQGLVAVDSLLTVRDWPAALERLARMLKPAHGATAAVLHEYVGFCHYHSGSLDRALHSFRQALAADSGHAANRQTRLGFAIGYLFQSRGFADSALESYSAARANLAATVLDDVDPLLLALYNNLALAHEVTGDTAGALAFYASAAELVDTTADAPSSRTVRDNLRRLAR
ncbi:MAG: hypothetical protein R6X12_03855 [bacterium]